MKLLIFRWEDFYEILYYRVLLKSIEKSEVWLTYDKNVFLHEHLRIFVTILVTGVTTVAINNDNNRY